MLGSHLCDTTPVFVVGDAFNVIGGGGGGDVVGVGGEGVAEFRSSCLQGEYFTK